jgi:ABC-type transport system involved in multi-copper enzyme maturation permease subunit
MQLVGVEIISLITVMFLVAPMRKKSRTDQTLHLLMTHFHKRAHIYISYLMAALVMILTLYVLIGVMMFALNSLSGIPRTMGMTIALISSYAKVMVLASIALLFGTFMS